MEVAAPLSQEGPKRSIECKLNVAQCIRASWCWLKGGLSMRIYSIRSSRVYAPYFLFGSTYRNASVLRGEHHSFGVLLATDVFLNSGQGYRRTPR